MDHVKTLLPAVLLLLGDVVVRVDCTENTIPSFTFVGDMAWHGMFDCSSLFIVRCLAMGLFPPTVELSFFFCFF
jgi:hypothetical protein